MSAESVFYHREWNFDQIHSNDLIDLGITPRGFHYVAVDCDKAEMRIIRDIQRNIAARKAAESELGNYAKTQTRGSATD